MRIIGIDYGTRRIGIALGDTESFIATPWRVLENDGLEEVLLRISQFMEQEQTKEMVVGVPKNPDGRVVSEIAEEVLDFIALLEEKGLTVHQENEMFSSKIAASQMEEQGRKEKRDDLAAAAILQTYLDRLEAVGMARNSV